jgi:hypothetical protein
MGQTNSWGAQESSMTWDMLFCVVRKEEGCSWLFLVGVVDRYIYLSVDTVLFDLQFQIMTMYLSVGSAL